MSQTMRCQLERQFLQTVVERVISISQIRCRRKKKLVKLWIKPKPGNLMDIKKKRVSFNKKFKDILHRSQYFRNT